MTKFQLPPVKYDKMMYMVLGILMLLALTPMAQAYAMIMNIIVFAMAAWLSISCWMAKKMENMWFMVFAFIAILFNPFMPIMMAVPMSMLLHLVLAGVFLYLFYISGKKEAK